MPVARGPWPEVQVAKSPLYALKRNIPHFAKGHMLRFCSPEAVFATGRSGDSGPGLKQEIFRPLFDSAEITNFTPEEKAKYQQDMTTERDIRNFITFAREEGMEKGREETRKLVTERLRERGFSEEEIQSILADKES